MFSYFELFPFKPDRSFIFYFQVCANGTTNKQRTCRHCHSTDTVPRRCFRKECGQAPTYKATNKVFLRFPTQWCPVSNFSHCLQVFSVWINSSGNEVNMLIPPRFRLDHGWRRLDFSSVSRMDRHIEMMMAIEKALIQAKCLVQPAIFIMPEVEKGICGMFWFDSHIKI